MSDKEFPSIDVVGVEKNGVYSSEAKRHIESADAVLGWERHLNTISDEDLPSTLQLEQLDDCIPSFTKFDPDERVILLASGDPLFYGIGRFLLERVPDEKLVFVPARSSIQLAFAALKEPYNDVVVRSLHGRPLDNLRTTLTNRPRRIALFTEPEGNTPEAIYEFLNEIKCDVYDFYLCENLPYEQESPIRIRDPSDFPGEVDPLNVVVLLRKDESEERHHPRPGISDDEFTAPDDTMVSKQELRLLDIGLLEVEENEVVWDVGAATGSISIESARLNPKARYFALEKRQDRYDNLVENIRRFETFNVIPVQGFASDLIGDLPDPDRVFLGGSGGELEDILSLTMERLNTEGKIIANFITLENFERTRRILNENSYRVRCRQLSMHESGDLAHYTRWEDGPVLYVIEAEQSDA